MFHSFVVFLVLFWLSIHSDVPRTAGVDNCFTLLLKFDLECRNFHNGVMKGSSEHQCDEFVATSQNCEKIVVT